MAGAGRRVFSPGEVLTASNTMNYLMDQSVMNFAGTAARGSAIGTAVAEGMVSYLADSNVVQAYDGSAWNSLAYATAVPAASTIALVPVIPTSVDKTGTSATYNSTTGLVTFTSVTALSLNGIFTSAYRNYRLEMNITGTSGTAGGMLHRYRNAGADRTSANYFIAGLYSNANGGSGAYSASSLTYADTGYLISSSEPYTTITMDLKDPYLPLFSKSVSHQTGIVSTGSWGYYPVANLRNVNESNDGVTFYGSAGTTFTGTVQVYGYK